MIYVPSFYRDEVPFDEAADFIAACGGDDLLKGMKKIDALWTNYVNSEDQDDDEFYEDWAYEINCFNSVSENMSKLFV
jgi:hypothetical protein